MKKILMILVIGLLAAAPVLQLMRFEVVNKSDYPAFLRLQEINYDNPVSYYLNVPAAGDLPGVRVFTLVRGLYDVEASYCNQEWNTLFINLDLNKARFRVTIPPCALKPNGDGDNLLKLNPWLYPAIDEFEVPIIYDLHFRY